MAAKILGFSGKAQSGKDTVTAFLIRNRKELFNGTVARYAFADELKLFCMGYLGLTYDQVYGSEAMKNTLTDINGMVSREVMQDVGKILRKYKQDIWVSKCFEAIDISNIDYAIITDIRYENEVEAVKKRGGKVIRLTRFSENTIGKEHDSEVELDNYSRFDAVIDNANMTITGANRELLKILSRWVWVKPSVVQMFLPSEVELVTVHPQPQVV